MDANCREHAAPHRACLGRREFIVATGVGAVTLLLGQVFPGGRVLAQDAGRRATVKAYPRKRIARLSDLKVGTPAEFLYPDDGPHSVSFLFKLGRKAGGGVGRDEDVVAFNGLCTHQGGSMRGQFNAEHAVAGPCPIHLTTFDLTRHGMVVAGHATQELPQIVLELEGDDVYAVAVLGLIYGYHDNTAYMSEGK